MTKYFLTLLIGVVSTSYLFSQNNNYFIAEVEGGLLTTSYSSDESSDPLIDDGNNANTNGKVTVGFGSKINENFMWEASLSQTFRFWNLYGKKGENTLKLKNRQSFPSVQVGALYQVNLTQNIPSEKFRIKTKYSILTGAKVGADFLNKSALVKEDGAQNDKVVGRTEKGSKLAVNAIPELGIKATFLTGNSLILGGKYTYPLNGDAISGVADQEVFGSTRETIRFNANGQIPSIFVKYVIQLH